jgi:hypothetical protein
MTGFGNPGGRKPVPFIFKLLQQHSTVSIWLYEQMIMGLIAYYFYSQLFKGKLVYRVLSRFRIPKVA